eukprot:CAMPEP_0170168088 /NCGR_PEP_ID=MMETSP0040_2-20121228/1268_1 /TAXON_ID=641309 /ORGANISM="Lotharella oceanica, Strain CCMP622" /LENGTH=30 /DNA_ID= /DNA_START= /DNA_END= /DNA_ORIENTATION=
MKRQDSVSELKREYEARMSRMQKDSMDQAD